MDELRPRFYPSKSITWKDRTKSNKASELLLSCKSRVAMAVGRLTDMWLWRSSPDCFYATLSTWLANFSLSSECSEKKWVRIELSGVLVASTTRRTVTGWWWEVRRGEEREGEGGGCGRPDDRGLTAPPAGQVAVLQQLKSILSSQSAVSSQQSVSCSDTARHHSEPQPGLAWPAPAQPNIFRSIWLFRNKIAGASHHLTPLHTQDNN